MYDANMNVLWMQDGFARGKARAGSGEIQLGRDDVKTDRIYAGTHGGRNGLRQSTG